jgi:hypothetical protein
MTLRAIEMQIALPRTTEAAHVQNQLSQKPVLDQSMLAQENLKQAEQQQKRANEVDKASTMLIKEDDARREQESKRRQGGARKAQGKQASDVTGAKLPDHPYKGRHIDLTL